MDKFIVGFGSTPREYVINGVRYVVESRFQKPDYKKPRENTLLNNRIGIISQAISQICRLSMQII